MFDQRLKPKVLKVVDVSYGGENGFNQAVELAQECLSNVKFVQEKQILSSFYEHIATDTGLICYGVKDTMRALEMGAIENLLLYENIEHFRVTFKNKISEKTSVNFLKPDQLTDSKYYKDELTGKKKIEFANVKR